MSFLTTVPPPADRVQEVSVPANPGKGDVDLNEVIDEADLLKLGAFLKGTETPSANQLIEGDLNINDKLDFSDYLILHAIVVDKQPVILPIALGNVDQSAAP
jgi:hypothetical protein